MSNPANSQPGLLPPSSGRPSLTDRVRSLRIPDRPVAQPVGRWWLPWVLCLIFAAAAAFFAFRAPPAPVPVPGDESVGDLIRKGGGSLTLDKDYTPAPGPVPGLSAEMIMLESKGYLVPFQPIKVSPKVAGTVIQLNIMEGQQVNKGDVLAELERIEYESEYQKIKGMLEAAVQRHKELKTGFRPQEKKQARAELDEAKAQLEYLLNEWQRNQKLGSKNALSPKELDLSRTDYQMMVEKVKRLELAHELVEEGPRREKIDAAAAEVEQLRGELIKTKWRLDNCTVLAPISGTILSKQAEEGDNVNPVAFNVSANLCEMADLYNLEADLSIAERDISKVFVGQKCKVRPEAYLNRSYWGTVSRLMPTADRAKGAITVRVKVHIPSRPDTVAAAVGLLAAPHAGKLLAVPPNFLGVVIEQQAEYLRPEMGVLVTFFNMRSEAE